MKLITPVPTRIQTITARRKPPGLVRRVLMIDGMQNRTAGWASAMLDGAEVTLRGHCPDAKFDRVERVLGDTSFSEDPDWAAGVRRTYDLLVEAVGD